LGIWAGTIKPESFYRTHLRAFGADRFTTVDRRQKLFVEILRFKLWPSIGVLVGCPPRGFEVTTIKTPATAVMPYSSNLTDSEWEIKRASTTSNIAY